MTDILDADYKTGEIKLHDAAAFEGMRKAGRLAAECLDMLTPHVVPGVVTGHLDDLAREFILDHGALPACLGYRGYTKTVCISPNHIVCHGIPASGRCARATSSTSTSPSSSTAGTATPRACTASGPVRRAPSGWWT
jgi:methionine aminopeptidase